MWEGYPDSKREGMVGVFVCVGMRVREWEQGGCRVGQGPDHDGQTAFQAAID